MIVLYIFKLSVAIFIPEPSKSFLKFLVVIFELFFTDFRTLYSDLIDCFFFRF